MSKQLSRVDSARNFFEALHILETGRKRLNEVFDAIDTLRVHGELALTELETGIALLEKGPIPEDKITPDAA